MTRGLKILRDTRETVISMSMAEKIIWYVIFSVGGMTLGYFFTRIVHWLIDLEWFMKWIGDSNTFVFLMNLLEKIQSFTGDWSSVLLSVIGLLCGLFLVHWLMEQNISIKMTDATVTVQNKLLNMEILRKDIQHVFLDNGELVIVGFSGHELLREPHDTSKHKIEQAFNKHGYPWRSEGDPYKDHYQLWFEDSPDLLIPENALMKAREKAIENDDEEAMRDLKSELAKLNIVVRDEDGLQYWRNV